MESAVVIILIICTVLVICIVIGAVFFYNKKRTLAFKELANELGMRFEASESGVLPICRELELFQRGHSKARKNILSNEGSDTSMSIFGYYYTTGSGDSSSRTAQTVFWSIPSILTCPPCMCDRSVGFTRWGPSWGIRILILKMIRIFHVNGS